MTQQLTVSLAQIDVTAGEPAANFERARSSVRDAAANGSSVVVLPELWSSGYALDRAAELSDELGAGAFAFMSDLARSHRIAVGGSHLERRAGRFYNTHVLYSASGELVAKYSKIHLFGLMDEPHYLAPGEEPVTAEMPWGIAAFAVCYDLRFPELFRHYAVAGARAVFICAQWPNPRHEHWRTLIRARAIENQSFVFACNRVGTSGPTSFFGGSLIVDPWGNVLAEGSDREELVTATVDPSVADEVRAKYPFLRDMRLVPRVPRGSSGSSGSSEEQTSTDSEEPRNARNSEEPRNPEEPVAGVAQ